MTTPEERHGEACQISREELDALLHNRGFRNILNRLQIGISLIDREGRILFFNRAIYRIYGLDADRSFEGTDIRDLFLTAPYSEEVLSLGVVRNKLSVAINGTHGISCRIPLLDNQGEVVACLAENIGGSAFPQQLQELQRLLGELRQILQGKQRRKPVNELLHDIGDIVGEDPRMRRIKANCLRFARADDPVLILGESGTGKELTAHALHKSSPRAEGPFVSVNCAALPGSLIEAELFGYREGAFTGSRSGGLKGKFELANEGTIFLDEIAELSLPHQAMLLRVLDSGEIQKIGHQSPEFSNFRLITATNGDIRALCQAGRFRRDLYHRISTLELELPPLRQRRGDIPLLAEHLLRRQAGDRTEPVRLDAEVLRLLMEDAWEGNIRELKNVLTYALRSLDDNEQLIRIEHLPDHFVARAQTVAKLVDPAVPLTNSEAKAIHDALVQTAFNKTNAAKQLGISRSQLYKRMRRLGMTV